MLSVIFYAFDALLPLRVKTIFHWNSTAAGLIFLANIIPLLLGPLGGLLSDKYGPRWLVVGSFALCLPLFILLRIPSKHKIGHVIIFCALLACIGFIISISMPGAMGEISIAVVEYEKGAPGIFGDKGAFGPAYALFNIASAVASIVGPLLGGFLNKSVGWNTVMIVFGCLCLFTSYGIRVKKVQPTEDRVAIDMISSPEIKDQPCETSVETSDITGDKLVPPFEPETAESSPPVPVHSTDEIDRIKPIDRNLDKE
ncbi:hypothetical protein H072_2814 [Dactylellina haptotyla CBS 200.50]|uniref:Major facilitator superfamily (MFS) profile domain-containing protein n=1 Tax=Dactylellina haptotyla (strain CBS 200.50) TaxID=1284197 RepID=S8BUP1_DACHA|nr:hypothetical protein H072_2814 [Dactylellina haptotyla CBS 200.50]